MLPPFGQHDELTELMPLQEILGNTSFVSTSGRVYRLFGSEEDTFSIPAIPTLPPALAAAKTIAVSLEDALQQIEMFSVPASGKNVIEQPKTDMPALQLFQALGEQTLEAQILGRPTSSEQALDTPLSHRLIRRISESEQEISSDLLQDCPSVPIPSVGGNASVMENIMNHASVAGRATPTSGTSSSGTTKPFPQAIPNAAFGANNSVNNIIESPQNSQKSGEEKRTPLRVIFDYADEPFIVPFPKPEILHEEPIATNVPLKIVTETLPSLCAPPPQLSQFLCPSPHRSLHCSKTLWKRRQHRCKENTPYRKPFSLPFLPPSSLLPTSPSEVSSSPPPVYETRDEPSVTTAKEPKPSLDVPSFQWSAQLNSLMQTASNQIRMLTDHLVVQSHQGVKAICFKSVFPGDGCSTLLLSAVRALVERRHRILLVDVHYRHIDLPQQLNLSRDLDSSTLASESEVITLNEHLGLWIWHETKTMEENMALLGEIITANRNDYDLILLDSGSLTESPLTEFVEFWNQIELDGIILVTNTKRPSGIPVPHIARRLRQHHIHLIGVAENYV
jgi:Mrp family chromosome partitioning ATPase